jgi:hypothetical protein
VDSFPLPRYAQGLSQTLATHDNNNRDDIRQGNNIVQDELTEFPRHKMRDLERPDHTTPPQNYDGDSDVSRSMRGHRITGPVPIGDYSDNFTQDLGEMMIGAGMSINEFCSTESSSVRRAQEMSRAFEGPPSITRENGRGNDHSRSLRRQTAARQTGQDEDSQVIANCVIVDIAWARENWDITLRVSFFTEIIMLQVLPRVYYHQLSCTIVPCPCFVLPRSPGQRGEHGIIGHPQQELYIPSGSPQSLRPIQGMEVETAMRAQQRGIGAHTQVWHKVAEIEQRGGSPTAQSSANRIGPIGWFPTGTNNEGKGLGKIDLHANYDATMGHYTPTTGLTSHITRNGSVKSVRSDRSLTLEELKVIREKAELKITVATAKREEAESKMLILIIDSQLSRPREGSRGTSATPSITSSHHSRRSKQHRNKPKHDERNRSLRAQLDEPLTSVRENSPTVNYDSALQQELRQGSGSGGVDGSARSGALEFYSNETEAQRTSTIGHPRSLQDAVDNGGTTTLPAHGRSIADDQITTTRPGHPGTRHSVVRQNAATPGQAVAPYCPSQIAPVDRRMAFPRNQHDAETGRMTDEMFMRTTIAKREHQMLMAAQLEKLQKAENMVFN